MPDATRIHPTAIISAEARLADDVTIGPYSVIDGPVTLGPGCKVGPYVHLIGPLTMGRDNAIHAGCVIGDEPQHTAYKGEVTSVEVGDGNSFREQVVIHRGMPVVDGTPGTGVTRIGSHNMFMSNSHLAHDCRVGDHTIFASGAVVGGHAEIHDQAFLSGNTAVHQFCRVGRLAFLGGTSAISQDLPPFWIVQGVINQVMGVNLVGMRRAGVPREEIQAVRAAFKLINRSGLTIPQALEQIEAASGQLTAVRQVVDFIQSSKRGVCIADHKSDSQDSD
ncbi:MAG TPA: acyl-ACP--UDP-N-acetylglucosamine O-acyltransferase [Fimbriiglobus sp.]|jgi:UDP-N-acetylglucosamine acyltransferase|nr:acyl-ACP--UDP-N-acetylglucosamine O-acyltransferase [Fimbriiglobus sp.]